MTDDEAGAGDRALRDTREALRQSAERLQMALAAGRLGWWSWEAAGDRLALDAVASAILDVDGASTTWADLRARIYAADLAAEEAAAVRSLAERKDYDVEYRLGTRAGADRWIAARGRPLLDAAGGVTGMIGVVQDLTARKQVDEALRESEARLRAMFAQAAVGFAVADLDGRFVQVNRKFAEIVGHAASDLVGRSFELITHPDDRARSRVKSEVLRSGPDDAVSDEKRYVRADGAVVWSLTTVTLLRDASGAPSRLLAVIEDITSRRRTEEALREETRVLEILNRTGAAIASELDLTTVLQLVTDAGTELSGARFGAFFYNATGPDGVDYQLYALSGADRSAFEPFGHPRPTAVFAPTFAGEVVRVADVTTDPRYGRMSPHFGLPSGHLPVRSYLAVPVLSRAKETLGALFFGHPEPGVFTERAERLVRGIASHAAIAIDNARLYEAAQRATEDRQRLLESEQRARAEAEQISEMKDQFLATLSHELRTPLGAILGWAQVIRTRKLQQMELQHAIEVVERNARAQARLVEDLLDMARIRSGTVRLERQPVDPVAALDAALETLLPTAEARSVELRRTVAPDVGLVSADPGRLQQVFWNLLSNAVKFSPKGGRVEVRIAPVAERVRVEVADAGVGIRPEFMPHLFDRFRQADPSITRSHGGLGLGLAIVKTLVELHDGTVTADSAGEHQGARFVVELPRLAH